MQNKVSFILVFIVFSTFTHAQSSGYMGKRLHIGYGFNTSPAIFGSNANNSSVLGHGGTAITGVAAFNVIHEGFLELILSGKWILGLSARYYKTTFDNFMVIHQPRIPSYSAYTFIEGKPGGYYRISGQSYQMYLKYYGKRYVAPWGRYIMFGPTLNVVTTNYDPQVMSIAAYNHTTFNDTIITNFGARDQNFKSVDLVFGWGRTKMLGKRISIDYGCNFQLRALFSTLFDIAAPESFAPRIETSENYIEQTVKKRVRGVNRFNVFIKVGILLF